MITELNLKTITAAIGVVSLLFAVYKFYQVQAIEAAKPYLEKKLELCEKVVESAALIAISEEPPKESVQEFWVKYYGALVMVEKNDVERAMVNFGKALDLKMKSSNVIASSSKVDQKGNSEDVAPLHHLKGNATPEKTLKNLSMDIAMACRTELSKDWSPSWLH